MAHLTNTTLSFKLQNIEYVANFIKICIDNNVITLAPINTAPIWLRVLTRNNAYSCLGTTIYVPDHHYSLVSSKQDMDRNIATAKLCKWFMAIHDFKNITALTSLKLMYANKYLFHYFLYEFFFLSGCNSPLKDAITLGFLSTRRNWFGKRIPYENALKTITDLVLNQEK